MRAAEQYDRTERAKGEPQGPLGQVGLEVLRELLRLVDHATGRLDPSIEGLASRLRRSRDAVWRALKALKTHGFIDWIRRYVPAPTAGRAGPQVRQTSNAYRLKLPAFAKALLGKATRAPIPDDHEQRRRAMADALRRMVADENGVGEAVDRFGRSVWERETARQAESAQINFIIGDTQQSPP
jgi:DNA-binding transcriptional MocR family regulator